MSKPSGIESNDLIQIIDKDGEFEPIDQLNSAVDKWEFKKKGFDYYVVAILGAQSSGKSTLLNLLFGTNFPVMDSTDGRQQTTQGVWMGKTTAISPKEESVLVFDVEGTDSRERGERAAAFERKTSLFSLALAHVLIINMWHNDIGRYNAGNIALLKTVFELNLHLFQKSTSQKTLILFIIRDHIAKETPLNKLQAIVMKDMNEIWAGLNKPEQFANSKVEDFFEFQFTSLSHKVLAEEEFQKGIENLKSRFLDSTQKDFILGPNYRKDIPADGFITYANRIWSVIKDNKDLDLPTQKEMLAMYRCDEIMAEIQQNFTAQLAPLKKILDTKGEIVELFGEKISKLYKNAMNEYDEPASRYHHEVAARKRQSLSNLLNEALHGLFEKQMQKIVEKSVQFFDKLLSQALPKDGPSVSDFVQVKETLFASTKSFFEERAKGSLLEGSEWSYHSESEELRDILNKHADIARKEQMSKLLEEIKVEFTTQFLRPLDKILDSPDKEMWPKIRKLYFTNKNLAMEKLGSQLKGFDCSEDEVATKSEELSEILFNVLKDRFISKVAYLHHIMTKRFEAAFNQDDQGLPRRWQPNDDIPAIFKEAREKAVGYLEYFAVLRLQEQLDEVKYLDNDESPQSIPQIYIILTQDEAQQIRDKFFKEIETSYLQALRDQEGVKSAARIPMYVIVLLIVLGFNEFIAVLSSPLLLITCIFLGIGCYVIYMMNMVGPVTKMIEAALFASLSGLQQWITENINKHDVPLRPVNAAQREKKEQ